MHFPVIILYVIVFISTSFADVRLVRVKRSVKPHAELDLNSLDFNSPEWVSKHLKNKIIQKDAITFELGTPQYEILNPEDQPEIITQDHPYYYENLKLYGQHDDYVQHDVSKNDDNKHNEYEQHYTNANDSMENNSTISAETEKADNLRSDESEDSGEEQFEFVFVKPKSTPEKTSKPTNPKSAKQDKESEAYIKTKEQHKAKDIKGIKSNIHQNQSQQPKLSLNSEGSTYDSYKEEVEEPQGAASTSSYQQYAYPPYSHNIPGRIYTQSTPYINPFYYYNNNYNYGNEQPPHMSEFEHLYRSALESYEQYNRKQSIYPQLYAPNKYYYY